MGDVLPWTKIDALPGTQSEKHVNDQCTDAGTISEKIRTYDFKCPNKFSKDQIHSLQNIFDKYCRVLTTYFIGHFHATADAKVLSIKQMTYDEFISSLPNPTILAIFCLNPLEGRVLMEMSLSLAFSVVELLLGGNGQDLGKNRVLTEIEQTIIEKRLTQMMGLIKEAWEEVYSINPRFLTLETNPQFIQIMTPNEQVVLVTVEVTIGEMGGVINICLPYVVLEPVLDKLSTSFLFSTQASTNAAQYVKLLQQNVEKAKVDVMALLGTTEILVKDLLNLAAGDVIPLSQSVQDPLPVYVGDNIKFKGIPGLHKEQLAVRLVEIVKDGGDQNG
ncbi:MAG TPA: flagellar motor switch protein FliM [Desulfitobacteriaceae bacterium]|nr:flagellar motor switch protein FliM [Desulfitobacteriaceae bacterium]